MAGSCFVFASEVICWAAFALALPATFCDAAGRHEPCSSLLEARDPSLSIPCQNIPVTYLIDWYELWDLWGYEVLTLFIQHLCWSMLDMKSTAPTCRSSVAKWKIVICNDHWFKMPTFSSVQHVRSLGSTCVNMKIYAAIIEVISTLLAILGQLLLHAAALHENVPKLSICDGWTAFVRQKPIGCASQVFMLRTWWLQKKVSREVCYIRNILLSKYMVKDEEVAYIYICLNHIFIHILYIFGTNTGLELWCFELRAKLKFDPHTGR